MQGVISKGLSKQIETIMSQARHGGSLVTHFSGKVKAMALGSDNGPRRLDIVARDNPDNIIGVYKVTDKFPESKVREYVTSDMTDHIKSGHVFSQS